ncbi:hypothetical protein Tco_1183284 [Tanacetum coccineum]
MRRSAARLKCLFMVADIKKLTPGTAKKERVDGVLVKWNEFVVVRGYSFTEDLKMEKMIAKSNHEITCFELNINRFCEFIKIEAKQMAAREAERAKFVAEKVEQDK